MINFDFQIKTDLLKLSLIPGLSDGFYLKQTQQEITFICPNYTNFATDTCQQWFRNAIFEQLRKAAKRYLPVRIKQLAEQYGFQYKRVSINSARTQIGRASCRERVLR